MLKEFRLTKIYNIVMFGYLFDLRIRNAFYRPSKIFTNIILKKVQNIDCMYKNQLNKYIIINNIKLQTIECRK